MKILHTGLISLAFLCVFGLNISGNSINAITNRVPGVQPGDWAKYSVYENYTSNDPNPPIYFPSEVPEYYKTEVISVVSSNISFQLINHFVNGTELSHVLWTDVISGIYPYFVAANLTIGDSIYEATSEFVINETINATYAGSEREVNCVSFAQNTTVLSEDYTFALDAHYFWDKRSGIITEGTLQMQYVRILDGYITYVFERDVMTETNVWFAGDIDADGEVNLKDIWLIARSFGSHGPDYPNIGDLASPNWNPKCDINDDKVVDVKDMYSTARNFGKTL